MSKVSPLVSIYDVLKKAFDHSKYNTPIGTIHQYAGENSPDGWLFCKGQDLLKADYPELYEVLGITYGTPSDGDYFRLPNFAGKVPVGVNYNYGSGLLDDSDLTERGLGEAEGEENHELSIAEMPQHDHGVTDSGHTHTYTVQNGTQTSSAGVGATSAEEGTTTTTTGSSTTGITIQSRGGGVPHNNMQPYLVVHYIIKYSHKYRTLEDVTYPMLG
jgi:microcystin-dependent protein